MDDNNAQQVEATQTALKLQKLKTVVFAVLALIMALGQYSEAVALINDAITALKRQFTHYVDYEVIESINVGNTVTYAEQILGSPQVSKQINEQVEANYFYKDKYLLTLFYKQQRIVAYTILPLIKDFSPEVSKFENNNLKIGEFNLARFPGIPNSYSIDSSKIIGFYIETLDMGRSGLLFNSYLGHLAYSEKSNNQQPHIDQFYHEEVMGDGSQTSKQHKILRENLIANFYGEGQLPLIDIEKSLLTKAEFNLYFDN